MNKRRLGKGLNAIIPDINQPPEVNSQEEGIVEIPLEKVKPNPHQPRKSFDEQKLKELADSMLSYGVIQPIIVQKSSEDEYLLAAGERRYRAAQKAGLDSIPALIKEFSAEQFLEVTLIENLQREDLNPVEEAEAYSTLMERFGLTQDELAKRLGKSRSSIANSLRLNSLDTEVKELLKEGKITAGQVRPLLSLESPQQQRKIVSQVIENNYTAREVEEMVKSLSQQNQARKQQSSKEKTSAKGKTGDELKDFYLQEAGEKLRQFFGTKVFIKPGKKEGKIELFFYGDEDLERLLHLLLKEDEI